MWDRFLRACRAEPVDRRPVWFMRQAGRYMPEYRALRERYGILELIKAPELAAEVTLQPIRAMPVDAAIIFADILTLLEGMGLSLEFARGEGPVIHNPIRREADVAALADPPIQDSLGFTLEAIRLVRREMDGRTPVIGFSGAPFTLASYAIEGGASRNYERTKGLMWSEPRVWDRLMRLLAERIGRYLLAQAAAGAQALQLFDSWAGALSPADYRRHALPYSRLAIEMARSGGVPVIHFSTGTGPYLDAVAEAGADVVGLDWRSELAASRRALGPGRPVQGNLDPVALQAPWPVLEAAADAILAAGGDGPGHIFNLGHGILPATDPSQVRRLVEHVHRVSARPT